MAKIEGYYVPKKDSIYVRGFGVIKKEDFNEDHYKALLKQCGDPDRAKQHLNFVEKKAKVKKATENAGSSDTSDHEIPTKLWTKEQIADFLNEKDVEFDLSMKKHELLDLCVPNENWSADQMRLFATINEIDVDGVENEKLLEFIESEIYE